MLPVVTARGHVGLSKVNVKIQNYPLSIWAGFVPENANIAARGKKIKTTLSKWSIA
ncbi:hypothetical protein K3X13_07005 [Aliiroseovarius crassostreae]|uniref:hypothetical protein n=1 Tax=Aliiroseovarius crassostreae TaxID=154981 RepID=UPI0021FC9BE5|nr:hypothetical protein [Aliiroseovarius crassostreae]UWP93559.1 hypothetical protein K3X13_07005 [Aliiroseovarius crassostreae]UWP99863.1 hypothetical protein K3X53_07005 [Aliiroseovarius crassostreae]